MNQLVNAHGNKTHLCIGVMQAVRLHMVTGAIVYRRRGPEDAPFQGRQVLMVTITVPVKEQDICLPRNIFFTAQLIQAEKGVPGDIKKILRIRFFIDVAGGICGHGHDNPGTQLKKLDQDAILDRRKTGIAVHEDIGFPKELRPADHTVQPAKEFFRCHIALLYKLHESTVDDMHILHLGKEGFILT